MEINAKNYFKLLGINFICFIPIVVLSILFEQIVESISKKIDDDEDDIDENLPPWANWIIDFIYIFISKVPLLFLSWYLINKFNICDLTLKKYILTYIIFSVVEIGTFSLTDDVLGYFDKIDMNVLKAILKIIALLSNFLPTLLQLYLLKKLGKC